MNEFDQSVFREMRAQGAASISGRVSIARSGWWRRAATVAACLGLGAVVSSCDASKALRPGKQKLVEMGFAGDSTIIVGSTVPVQFTVTVDGEEYAFPRLEIVSSDTSVIALGGDGRTLVARRRGHAEVTARFISAVLPEPPAKIQHVYVVAKSVRMERTAATFSSLGDSAQLSVEALDVNDEPLPAVAPKWVTNDPAIATVSVAGVVTARGNGTVKVGAVVDFDTVFAEVTVQQRLSRFSFTTPVMTLDALGAEAAVGAVGMDAGGSPITTVSGAGAVWSVANTDVATVTPAGVARAVSNGETWARASAVGGVVVDSVRLVVAQRATKVVVTTPGPLAMAAIGQQQKIEAHAFDRLDRPMANKIPLWVSRNPRVAYVDTLTAQAKAIDTGSTYILAQLDAAADSIAVRVTNLPARVLLDAHTRTLSSVGDTLRLAVTVESALPAPIAGWPVAWHSTDTTVVRVLGDGRAVATGAGVARVVAAAVGSDVADTAAITVTNAVARLDLLPASVVLESVGDSLVLPMVLANSRGMPIADRAAVDWKSDEADLVRVTATGTVIALRDGATMVRATGRDGSGVRDSVAVVVTNAPASIVLAVQHDTITAVGKQRVYAAEVRNKRGALIAGYRPEWISRRPAVALAAPEEIVGSSRGVVTAAGEGVTWVVARAGTQSDSVEVTVGNIPASLELDRRQVSMTSVGDTVQLRAIGRNDFGVEVAGFTASWRTPDASFATVLPDGRVISRSTGLARVIASWGTLADTAYVTVSNVVDRVDLAANAVTMASVNDSLTPAVSVTNARGADLGRSAAIWSSDDPLVARVTTGGLVIARGAGQTFVRASSPTLLGRTDSLLVTVTNAPVTLVLNAHVDSMIALTQTRTYAAELRNARGVLVPEATLTWRSTTPAAATVTQSGLATATGVGNTMIIAQSGAVADTVRLSVYDRAKLVVTTPPAITMNSVGDTLRLTGAVWNLFNLPVAGATLSWRSTDVYVAQVLSDGRVIAIGRGTARVIASYATFADTTDVTVTNAVVSVNILPTTATLTSINDSTTPDLDVRNSRGTLLQRTDAAWASDDPAIARVSAYGTITAKEVGRTVVRVASPANASIRDSIVVTVTNDAAAITIEGATAPDTLTGPGQTLAYVATARNKAGAPLAASAVSWQSTNGAVAAVSPAGVVTAMGYGTALVIAEAAAVSDTAIITVINPTRLFVDNGVVVPLRVGTAARPFARIQDAVNTADAGDTVVVRPGSGGYSEAVTLGRRITLLGDSTAFVAAGRDPLRLPRISHDLGSAGVLANTPGASFVIRYLAVQNTVDGDAVAVLGASNVIVEYVYVNPGTQEFRSGSGIAVEGITGSAVVARSFVQSVVGYGVRLRNVQNGRVDGVTVKDVGASAAAPGAGVQVVRGANNRVLNTVVRRTDGPQVAIDSTAGALVTGNDLAGEQALMRVLAVSGLTTVDGNAFDLRRQAGDAAPLGPSAGRAGLTIQASSGVTVSSNSFIDFGGTNSQIDAVRLSDARPTGGAAAAVTLATNRFNGSRHAIHSERSTWAMTGTRVDNAAVPVYGTEADSITLVADTLVTAVAGCVQANGASSLVDASRSAFLDCSTDGTAAVGATGAAATLDVDSSAFVGANQRALSATQARFVSMRANTVSGAGALSLPTVQRTIGAVDVVATDSIRFVGNDVREYRAFAAASLKAATVRADSNFVTRNLVGMRLGSAVNALIRDNSFVDNDVLGATQNRAALGLANDGALPLAIGSNWWGDDRGPQRAANALAVGDSATGLGLPPATFAAAPILAHQGAGQAASVRIVRGDSQSVRRGTTLPRRFTVRVVDAAGRPLAGIGANVQFVVGSGGGTITGATNGVLTVTPNASGLAEVTFTAPNTTGICKVSATVGTQSVVFTVTSTP